uniref:Reverse transcriptase Ty1/copia-type domain-containing protein n=1 Tax=Fagus sylvatica TaxID=28930 RepID=A0A2N9HE40_FAGSY
MGSISGHEITHPITVILDGPAFYHAWSQNIIFFLKGRRLWRYVTGDIPKPVPGLVTDSDSSDGSFLGSLTPLCLPLVVSFLDWKQVKRPGLSWPLGTTALMTLPWNFILKFKLYQMRQEFRFSLFLIIIHRLLLYGNKLAVADPPLRYAEDIDLFAKYKDRRCFTQFMMSLREDFEPTRATLLSRSPLPSLDAAVKELISEENWRPHHHLSSSDVVLATPFAVSSALVDDPVVTVSQLESMFHRYMSQPSPALSIHLSSHVSVTHIGTISSPDLTIPDTYLVPKLSLNLLSVGQLCQLGHDLHFSNRGVDVQDALTGKLLGTGSGAQIGVLEGNMQRLQQQVVDNTGSIDRLHLKVDGLEVGMAEIRAMMLPIGAEERNALSMRAPNHEVHFNPNQSRFSMPYDDPFEPRPKRLNGGVFLNLIVESLCGLGNARPPPSFEGQCGLYGEEFWREKRVPRQQQQFHTVGQQAQPQRHASQAREPRNALWPQGDVVEPWYNHGGGRGNCGRERNYQGPQDRDPYGKNQDPLQRQQERYAREPRAMELEFPRFKGDDDALIWFQNCEHDLGCWDNFATAIKLRFGPPSYDDPMELLIKLKHVNSIEEYKGLFESLSNKIRNLSSMHKLSCFISGLKDEVRLAIKMQGPRTLGKAYASAKIQEQYLANLKRSTRPSYEANKDNWEQYSSQQVAAQFGPKVATQVDPRVAEFDPKVAAQFYTKVAAQVDPKVTAQLDPKVAVQFDPKVAAQLNPKAMKLYLIEEVQKDEGAYVTSDEEEERVEWCEERRNTKEESINKHIQVPSRYWLIGRSPLMKKQLEDSSSIRPQQDHNLEDKGEAALTAIYSINRIPSPTTHKKSPFELLYDKLPNYSSLRVFGCVCFVSLPSHERNKHEPRSRLCCFLGYGISQKGFRCYDPISHRLRISRHVEFWEHQTFSSRQHFPFISSSMTPIFTNPSIDLYPNPLRDSTLPPSSSDVPSLVLSPAAGSPASNPAPLAPSESPTDIHRSTRVRALPSHLTDYHCYFALATLHEPHTYREASTNPLWQQAMADELDALHKTHTWDMTTLPPGKSAVDCKWVYKIKTRADGSVECYKARLVARGFTQVYGIRL